MSIPTDFRTESGSRPSRWLVARVALLCVAGVLSVALYQIALIVVFLTLLGFLTLPKLPQRTRRKVIGALSVAAVTSGLGLLRFIAIDALPGMVAGGAAARERNAVGRLRQIVFAEDMLRKDAPIDPDHDGIGSAALIQQLTGSEPLANGRGPLREPPLNREFGAPSSTRLGPALRAEGYLFIVCLPRVGGGWASRPGTPVNEEAAERRFVAYAWPAVATRDARRVYFIDEHERIEVSENREPGKPDEPHFAGPSVTPRCDTALAPPGAASFAVWHHKKPRVRLPGDRPH